MTLQVGSNDVLLLEEACNFDPTCIASGLPQVLTTASTNVATILAALRNTGYNGAIVVVNYYSTDYSDQGATQVTAALNQAITAPAPFYGAGVADVFSAFEAAASQTGGKTCVTGLLNAKPGVPTVLSCDEHPSQSGHKLIAQTILGAYQSRSGQKSK